jgi:DNA-binding LacI/PurR family transcriptional regulator
MNMTTKPHRVSLKQVAEHLGVHPTTVSVVLNDVPGRSISQATRDRIKAAAKDFNYQPSLLARSLRNRRTLSIGVLVPDLAESYHNQIVRGIGDQLMESGYFYFTAHHRRKRSLVDKYGQMLLGRGVDGLIAIDTPLDHPFPVPTVGVAAHRIIQGITNVVLDHRRAAELILTHLQSLGHRRIVFVRGQEFSADARERWRYLLEVAREKGIPVRPELVFQLKSDTHSPELGFPVVRQLISRKERFTAVVAFNDMSAIGMIRALADAKIRVPGEVSIVGFDDIEAAEFTIPRLTTVRQPLSEMGRIAAQCVLQRIQRPDGFQQEMTVEPELVVRESTASKSREQRQFSGPK